MKWMEVLDPTKLDANEKYDIEDLTTEKLQEFRNEIISEIISAKATNSLKKPYRGQWRRPSTNLQLHCKAHTFK
ncbi:hypothetical protein PIB30_071991 [Stylosanthes scabra]|uniref:Uncharacterized protein n=1 Tax=Stylosanthes scabra TaxID=79078 RepID=A0ABU6WM77_9FABA|nr:hypothetical protein [Stylosanthes scabra]